VLSISNMRGCEFWFAIFVWMYARVSCVHTRSEVHRVYVFLPFVVGSSLGVAICIMWYLCRQDSGSERKVKFYGKKVHHVF
jgi:hypothetical protein